jgi:hypothetical protein
MAANVIRNKRYAGRLLCSLLFALLITAAGWTGAKAYEEIIVRSLNASGNRNIPPAVDPIEEREGYSAVLYDNLNGLPTSEANAIAQTDVRFFLDRQLCRPDPV